MKAIIYCRVSTKEQAEKGYSLEGQEKDCRQFAHNQGLLKKANYKYTATDNEIKYMVRRDKKCKGNGQKALKPVHF